MDEAADAPADSTEATTEDSAAMESTDTAESGTEATDASE
jgi:hypothetical protein